jgi:hypothetical protein
VLLKLSPYSLFVSLILIIAFCLFTSCNDDATIVPPCQLDVDMSIFGNGEMNINDESYFLSNSFIQNGSDIDTIRRFDISGFKEDCERRDQVTLRYNLLNAGDLTGTYNIAIERDSISGNASGILLTQIVETLEQVETPLNSGSFTITDNGAGDLFISLEVETSSGDVVVVESPIDAN